MFTSLIRVFGELYFINIENYDTYDADENNNNKNLLTGTAVSNKCKQILILRIWIWIWIGIKVERRILARTMPIHNTGWTKYYLENLDRAIKRHKDRERGVERR